MLENNHFSSRTGIPHFIIIGAPKSGTTWLVEALRRNECVYIPTYEIHYFSRLYKQRNWRWYQHHFRDAQPHALVGENSNTYLTDGHAAARIRSRLPDANLIAVLRNPIERAYSGYCMQFNRGKFCKNIGKYLDPRAAEESNTLEYGKYYKLLIRYLDLFPREQIFLMIYDDIWQEVRAALVELAMFLKMPRLEHVAPLSTRVNARKTVSMAYPIRRILWPMVHREAVRRPLVKFMRAIPLWRETECLLSRPIVYPPLPEELRRRLGEYYAEDVAELSRIVGKDLSYWLDPMFAP